MSRNVEDVLERAGEYLMQRTAEYRKLPVAPRHDAVSYTNEIDPGVVWQERPDVLVWVTVPTGINLDPATVAQGIQRVDGPTSIPNRVIPALARPHQRRECPRR